MCMCERGGAWVDGSCDVHVNVRVSLWLVRLIHRLITDVTWRSTRGLDLPMCQETVIVTVTKCSELYYFILTGNDAVCAPTEVSQTVIFNTKIKQNI